MKVSIGVCVLSVSLIFLGAFLGGYVGSESFAPEVKFKSGLSPLPECGSEGHPDTGELVIVLCSETNEKIIKGVNERYVLENNILHTPSNTSIGNAI